MPFIISQLERYTDAAIQKILVLVADCGVAFADAGRDALHVSHEAGSVFFHVDDDQLLLGVLDAVAAVQHDVVFVVVQGDVRLSGLDVVSLYPPQTPW